MLGKTQSINYIHLLKRGYPQEYRGQEYELDFAKHSSSINLIYLFYIVVRQKALWRQSLNEESEIKQMNQTVYWNSGMITQRIILSDFKTQ